MSDELYYVRIALRHLGPKERLNEPQRPRVGQAVIWLQQRPWGGKQNEPAKYLHGVGRHSARIELSDKTEKTVRLKNLRWNQ